MDSESVNSENNYSDFESKESVLISLTTRIESTNETFENFFSKMKTFIDLKSVTMFNHVVTSFLLISFIYL